jgi:cobalt/nickel transport system permease protein
MSHLHIPDGVLPWWLIGLGWLVAAVMVGVALRLARRAPREEVVPRVGVVAALVVAAMSTEIVPIAYHVNLTVLAGIVLGPAAGPLVALVVNIVLALFGHGGVTVIGLNTVITGTEMILGWSLFRGLRRLAPARIGLMAGLATVLTLMVTTTMLVGVVALSGIDPGNARDTGSLNPATLSFSNPFAGGLLANRIVTPEQEGVAQNHHLSLGRFALAVYGLGAIGWAIEGTLTGFMVAFVARVRPGLLALRREAAWT